MRRSPEIDEYNVVGFEAIRTLPDHSNMRMETRTSPTANSGNYLDIAQARRKNIQQIINKKNSTNNAILTDSRIYE